VLQASEASQSSFFLSSNEAELRERFAASMMTLPSYMPTLHEKNNDAVCILHHLRAMLSDGRLAQALKGACLSERESNERKHSPPWCAVATILTEEVVKAHPRRFSGPVLPELRTFWTDAMLSTHLPRAERETWAKKLEVWNEAVHGSLSPSPTAARNGWDEPRMVALLRGDLALADNDLDEPHSLLETRVSILRKQGRMQEVLHLLRGTPHRVCVYFFLFHLSDASSCSSVAATNAS
jgi:hypothetical protein